jgi:hypothetical protein
VLCIDSVERTDARKHFQLVFAHSRNPAREFVDVAKRLRNSDCLARDGSQTPDATEADP